MQNVKVNKSYEIALYGHLKVAVFIKNISFLHMNKNLGKDLDLYGKC